MSNLTFDAAVTYRGPVDERRGTVESVEYPQAATTARNSCFIDGAVRSHVEYVVGDVAVG